MESALSLLSSAQLATPSELRPVLNNGEAGGGVTAGGLTGCGDHSVPDGFSAQGLRRTFL